MSDKVTTSKTLNIVVEFVDGDTRTLPPLDNPKDNLTKEQINAVAAIAKTSNLLIGDKAGADFKEFKTAKVLETERIVLDLNS